MNDAILINIVKPEVSLAKSRRQKSRLYEIGRYMKVVDVSL